MSYDVVVVGGGIGGLTVAALLSARGVKTCLLERQSQVGGCVARVEISGLNFEPGMGLYPSWGSGEIHDRIFSELPVTAPEIRPLESAYLVRLPDGSDVKLDSDDAVFADEIRKAFPECATSALAFYKTAAETSNAWLRAIGRTPDLQTAGRAKKIRAFLPEAAGIRQLLSTRNKTALDYLQQTSTRFQSFIDSQLRVLAQTPVEQCDYLAASIALNLPRRKLFTIVDGPASLAERLADSLTRAGGTLRLNSPVLRLAYDKDGSAVGVDLLSGETVFAKRAIISNMTVWDTYGKLIGLGRTPPQVKQKLSGLQANGAYVIYATIDEAAATRLPAERLLVGAEWQHESSETELAEFTLAVAERGPAASQRTVTIQTNTDVSRWFTFQASEEDQENRDQEMLEAFWAIIHRALPELGAGIEVLETANPRTFYELTRRKLGMVRGTKQVPGRFGLDSMTYQTSLPNVFMVGDTVFPGAGLAAVSHSALIVANAITR
jgi:phytoene dehydrogenase-like protein